MNQVKKQARKKFTVTALSPNVKNSFSRFCQQHGLVSYKILDKLITDFLNSNRNLPDETNRQQ